MYRSKTIIFALMAATVELTAAAIPVTTFGEFNFTAGSEQQKAFSNPRASRDFDLPADLRIKISTLYEPI